MASDKRSFTDFEEFPGKINEDTNNYEFPKLFKKDTSGKIREWVVLIRLIKQDSQDKVETKKQNWNLLAENQIPIKPEYIADTKAFPKGTLVELWTETGAMRMKISRASATYVIGKNIGKKNERNPLQQALVEARNKYLKKINDGSSPNLTDVSSTTEVKNLGNVMHHPMLAKKYEDIKAKDKAGLFPAEIQPKFDGVRYLAYLQKAKSPTYKDVILYSRSQKEYPYNPPNNILRKALLPGLVKYYDHDANESIQTDGEFYVHGRSLQQTSSDARSSTKEISASEEAAVEYHIYDIFYPSYTNEPFTERTKIRKALVDVIDSKHIIFVKSKIAKNEDELDKLYLEYLEQKYEGIMIRGPKSPYLKSAVKSSALRSKYLLKYKPVYDDEFEVVGYTQGDNGKEVGAVSWICAAGDETFKVTPNMPYTERYKIYKECVKHFDTKYKNRLMTVEYRSKSDSGVPLCAKAIGFRDVK
jgi:ATP-dependent DNA ligase